MTQIRFDVISPEYRFPLRKEAVRRVLGEALKDAPDLRDAIESVRFGCNRHTTQEGRLAQRGGRFHIRINFCLKDGKTRLLSTSKSWLLPVTVCGGVPDTRQRQVVWSESAAARYATFLLFHETAHMIYQRRKGAATLSGTRGAREEERFCDEWALGMLARWRALSAPEPRIE